MFALKVFFSPQRHSNHPHHHVSIVSAVVCHLCLCLSTSISPMRPFHAACGFVCVKILITTHSPAPTHTRAHTHTHTHTHTQSIGVQSGKGLSVVLCEWPLLKQINRHWHVPPPTKRKQLKTIDPVPVSSMNMHVSLTFPWRGKERERERQTDRQTGVAALSVSPLSCGVNWFVTVFSCSPALLFSLLSLLASNLQHASRAYMRQIVALKPVKPVALL